MRSLLATLFFRLISLLPLRLNYALGGFIGWWMAVIPNNLRHITRINIALCYPDMPSSERAALVRASLKSTARTAIEAGPMWLWSVNGH
ncbi:hypothetical protein [Candidatus Reidiella endopervernicosa]|uniref:Lipid A biosynthesis acyltransferase n=1 Tax=Candidatus Reidiella endopervernicosa TaxID=2738883 RepID=A0A6N0HS78_9GAMM|nr:hypothetical protein [Candidatus Reidiella endopervernicosa]QKQ25245.1 hypothetical protein HUE57_02265 [Candidatus Reidiella endopervernicosa]